MSEVNISLYELLNICFGTPQQATVNFSALHALVHAVLKQLGLGEVRILWSDSSPADTLIGRDPVTEDGQLQVQLQKTASPGDGNGTAAELESKLRSHIQSCEDGVSKVREIKHK